MSAFLSLAYSFSRQGNDRYSPISMKYSYSFFFTDIYEYLLFCDHFLMNGNTPIQWQRNWNGYRLIMDYFLIENSFLNTLNIMNWVRVCCSNRTKYEIRLFIFQLWNWIVIYFKFLAIHHQLLIKIFCLFQVYLIYKRN